MAFNVENKITSTIDLYVDILFLVDIAINFRTTYASSDGSEISNQRLITKNYLHGSFTVDFLSTVPFDKFALILVDEE